MKTLSIIAALAVSLTNAHARVGGTAQEIETRYGKPKREKQQSHGNISREYSYLGFRVLVSFRNGVCYAESYQKSPPTPFLESEVSALLRANAGGGKWDKVPTVTGLALVLYRGPDNRVAIHDTVRHTLHFSKEDVVIQKTIQR